MQVSHEDQARYTEYQDDSTDMERGSWQDLKLGGDDNIGASDDDGHHVENRVGALLWDR
jgi:hypothetical protein